MTDKDRELPPPSDILSYGGVTLSSAVTKPEETGTMVLVVWRPIETAPKSGYIIGAWQDGSRWRAAQMFSEHDEWVDVASDRILSPTHWAPLPDA